MTHEIFYLQKQSHETLTLILVGGAGIDRQLPAHRPRENRVHRPAATDAAHDVAGDACGCTECGGRLPQIGADVSEQLEFVPSRFKVIRHVRPKLACVACQTIFQAAAPSRPIARGVAGPALLANVLVSKYCTLSLKTVLHS